MDLNDMKVLFGAAALLLLIGCSSKLDKVRESFIDSCKSSGAPTAKCECAIDKLEEQYGEKKLVAISESGHTPSDFFEQLAIAGQQCREE